MWAFGGKPDLFVSLQTIPSLSEGYAPARMTVPLLGQRVLHGYVVCHPEMPSLIPLLHLTLTGGER